MSTQPRYRIVCADGLVRHRPQHPTRHALVNRYCYSLNCRLLSCGLHRVEEVPDGK